MKEKPKFIETLDGSLVRASLIEIITVQERPVVRTFDARAWIGEDCWVIASGDDRVAVRLAARRIVEEAA